MLSMDERMQEIIQTAENTRILREPKNVLATFGTTRIHYFVLTEPVYKGIIDNADDTIVREGHVIAERPKIITALLS